MLDERETKKHRRTAMRANPNMCFEVKQLALDLPSVEFHRRRYPKTVSAGSSLPASGTTFPD